MQSLCLSSFSYSQFLHQTQYHLSHHNQNLTKTKPLLNVSSSNTTHFNPLRLCVNQHKLVNPMKQMKKGMGSSGAVCSSLLSPSNLHWVSAVASVVLMLVKGSAINRSFLVPLFALQAPVSVIGWMQGEYGAWSAFLALLVRLFFFIPAELELPLVTLLLVLVAPRQAMNLRGRQPGILISLIIGAYLAFQHFTRVGGLQKSFDQGSIVATLAILCIAIVPCLLLI